MSVATVEAREVVKVFQTGKVKVTALQGVTLTVAPGDFLALAGPSGSGKTTLLNLMGCLDRPTGGEIFIDGEATGRLSAGKRADFRSRRIGFVFQSYNLIPVLSALENVELPAVLQGAPAARRRRQARELLEAVGLLEKAGRRPAELSGGEQQRVAVARALVTGPAVILADEPTANLDSATGSEVLATMRRLNREQGATFVFATHDPLVIERVDRVIRLRDGRIEPPAGAL